MIEWNNIVIGLCVLLLIFLIWKEVKRANKARFGWRLLATIFAVIGLACLALPITYRHPENDAINREAVLLTEGFSPDSVNNFLSVNNNNIPVFRMNKNLKRAGKYNASYIPDIDLFAQRHKDLHTFHVFGYGMEQDDLEGLKNWSLIFHQAKLSSGITSIKWSHKIRTGEKLFIQGSFNNPSSSKVKIVLKSFNATLDSVNVLSGTNQKFQLATIPKHAGRAVSLVIALAGKDTIEKEMVPVEVEQGDPLKVLILASSPDFDNKFLKDRLAQNGYVVVERTSVSKNKFEKNFLNTPTVPLGRITSSLLDKFDVTIADAAALNSLSTPELTSIQTQVAQKSMGLIVKADSVSNSSFYSSSFPLATSGNRQLLGLSLSDSTNFPAINVESVLSIRSMPGTQPLVADKQNRVFVNSSLFGSGKIVLTTLANTFSWALAGYQNDYDKFWTELLNKVSAKQVADEAWTISPALPKINKRVQVQVHTNSAKVPQGQVGEAAVYLKQNPDLPYQWDGIFYPTKAGWQVGIQLSGKPFYWYAYDKSDWKMIGEKERLEATVRYLFDHNNILRKGEKEARMIDREINKLIFLLLFLFCAGYMWFENKV